MATKVVITARLREERGKGAARRMRREGRVPAVLYGRGAETQAVSVDAHELDRLFAHINVESTLIDVKLEGKRGARMRALVREVQTHAYRPEILHVDLYLIQADEPVDVEIPVRITGESVGVKEGGVLQQVLHDLAIRCLPDVIPEAIEVDVSELDIGDSIHVSDLAIPEGVSVEIDPERTVCSVVPPTVEVVEEEEEVEVPEELEAEAEEEPELIRKRPEEEEEESPAAEQEG